MTIPVAALNVVAFGIVVCNARGHVIFANTTAKKLADETTGISITGTITTSVTSEARILARLIRDVTTSDACGAMQISGRRGEANLLVIVKRLPQIGRRSANKESILVAFRRAWDNAAFSEAKLTMLFRLSPLQASLAIAIFNGQSVSSVASGRGVKISTIRTHLSEIFAKTGAKTQGDLIRLLATLPPLGELEPRA